MFGALTVLVSVLFNVVITPAILCVENICILLKIIRDCLDFHNPYTETDELQFESNVELENGPIAAQTTDCGVGFLFQFVTDIFNAILHPHSLQSLKYPWRVYRLINTSK